jgi:hypothetical protein
MATFWPPDRHREAIFVLPILSVSGLDSPLRGVKIARGKSRPLELFAARRLGGDHDFAESANSSCSFYRFCFLGLISGQHGCADCR